jgi:hypothetical protein
MYTSPFYNDHDITPTFNEKIVKVCFHCGQRCHFALQYPNWCQWQTPPNKKCNNCEEKGHFANVCPNPRSRPPLPPSTRQHPITKEVLRQSKRPRHDSIMDRLVILPIDARTRVNYRPQPKATRIWHELRPTRSATTMEKRITLLMSVPINNTALMWQW